MASPNARLGVEVFDLPVPELRSGYRSAVYFSRTRKILAQARPDTVVTVQVFQKAHAVLSGVDEAVAILRMGAGSWSDPVRAGAVFDGYLAARLDARRSRAEDAAAAADAGARQFDLERELDDLWVPGFDLLDVTALHDGDEIEPWTTVLAVAGAFHLFAHLESVYLGVLARRTRIATNVARVVAAARGKPLLFFGDRFDHFATQEGDGYAARIAGARGVATDAMAAWWGEKGLGTMPHAVIAAFDGDAVAATGAFADHVPHADLVALVDFNNDCVGDSLACARAHGDRLWGVRLDTAATLVDRSITPDRVGDFDPTGVNVPLVRLVRQALDAEGFGHVRIVVSGGFDADRITDFEVQGAPVDAYAVGSSLLRGAFDFTADVVAVNGREVAKVGRRFRPNPDLQVVQ